jgi:hypothetical protein
MKVIPETKFDIYICITHRHGCPLSWLGTGTSIKQKNGGGV